MDAHCSREEGARREDQWQESESKIEKERDRVGGREKSERERVRERGEVE